jgi:hypothetical protein
MQSIEDITERILYWLSLDTQVRALTARLLERFAVKWPNCQPAPNTVTPSPATSQAFFGIHIQIFGGIRQQHGCGASGSTRKRSLPPSAMTCKSCSSWIAASVKHGAHSMNPSVLARCKSGLSPCGSLRNDKMTAAFELQPGALNDVTEI